MNGGILFLAHRVPFPPDRGDKIRSWNVLKALAKIAPVHVAALVDPADPIDALDPLRGVSASLTLVNRNRSNTVAMAAALASGRPASVEAFASTELSKAVSELLNQQNIQAIYAFSGQMGQFVPESHHARFIMDFVDMDSAKFEDFAKQKRGAASFANRQEARRLFAFERALAQRADVSLFVSEAEASLFRVRTGLGPDRVSVLENGVDLNRYTPAHAAPAAVPGKGPLLVFTGQMDYQPNVEAVVWFANKVLPLLKGAQFAIVGRAPTPDVQALARLPGVTVTGEVADPRDWIAAADLVVAPLLLARGIQNKVLEAMAMAKPVIASPQAAEGIDAVNGEHFVVADGPGGFAEAIRTLSTQQDLANGISAAARAQMEARYGWDACLARLPVLIAGDPSASACHRPAA